MTNVGFNNRKFSSMPDTNFRFEIFIKPLPTLWPWLFHCGLGLFWCKGDERNQSDHLLTAVSFTTWAQRSFFNGLHSLNGIVWRLKDVSLLPVGLMFRNFNFEPHIILGMCVPTWCQMFLMFIVISGTLVIRASVSRWAGAANRIYVQSCVSAAWTWYWIVTLSPDDSWWSI